MSPDLKSGQAIFICEILALILADNLSLEKPSTVLFCALNWKTRPEQFRLAGPLCKNSQKQLPPRDTKLVFVREWKCRLQEILAGVVIITLLVESILVLV